MIDFVKSGVADVFLIVVTCVTLGQGSAGVEDENGDTDSFLYFLTDAVSVRVGSFAELLCHKMLGRTIGLPLDEVLL